MQAGPSIDLRALRPIWQPQQLDYQAYGAALDGVIVLSAAFAILWLALHLGRGSGRRETAAPVPADQERGVWPPLWAFLLVCALLLANQALVQVYVLREHDGSASFVSRYLGRGWFALATQSRPIRWLSQHLPASVNRLLPYTILRVQAALELPFVISAYLAIAGFVSPDLWRALWRSLLLPAALVSFTATFCLIEMLLWSPWTLSDLRWRWISCAALVVLWALSRLLGEEPHLTAPAGSGARLVVLLGGGGALALGVMLMYDVALLYNLGHLQQTWQVLLGCTVVALCAASLSERAAWWVTRPAASGACAGLAAFTWVFFVPALAIRYAGTRSSAEVAALVLAGAALLGALVLAQRVRPAAWRVLGLLLFLAAGASAAWADTTGQLGLPWPASFEHMLELRLLRGALVLLVAGGAAAALLDGLIWLGRPPRR